MKVFRYDIIMLRPTTIGVDPRPHIPSPNREPHAPELATVAEPEEPPLLIEALLVGGAVLLAVTLIALTEAPEAVVAVTGDPADALNGPVIPTHSVARKAEIMAASVGLVCEACRHEMHPGPLA